MKYKKTKLPGGISVIEYEGIWTGAQFRHPMYIMPCGQSILMEDLEKYKPKMESKVYIALYGDYRDES